MWRLFVPIARKTVAVIEREHLGGICLNWAVFRQKLRAAEMRHNLAHMSDFGIEVTGEVKVNLEKVVSRSRKLQHVFSGVAHLLKKKSHSHKRSQLGGKSGANWVVEISGKDSEKTGQKAVCPCDLATGARMTIRLETDGKNILSYKEAMVPSQMPNLIVVGSGAIGVEFASFYADMGVEVTIIEALDRILNAQDEEISALAHKSFTERGRYPYFGKIAKLTSAKDMVTAEVEIGGKRRNLPQTR